MFCSPSVQAPMPPGTHNIVPARRLCKQYKLFRPPQSATTRRLALRPVPILHAGKRHTVKPPLRTPSFLPFFGKKGRPARRGQRPPAALRRRSFVLARGEQTLVPPQRKRLRPLKPLLQLPLGQLRRHRPPVGAVFPPPTRFRASGVPGFDFAPGQVNCPCAKVLCLRPKTLVRRTRGGAFGP